MSRFFEPCFEKVGPFDINESVKAIIFETEAKYHDAKVDGN